jgi:hypothetical protein
MPKEKARLRSANLLRLCRRNLRTDKTQKLIGQPLLDSVKPLLERLLIAF